MQVLWDLLRDQRRLNMILSSVCINRKCQWHYRECRPPQYRDGLLLHGRVLLSQEFYRVYLPFVQLICFMRTGGGFSSQQFPFLLVAHLCWAVCLLGHWSLPLVSFSLPSRELSFYKVWQGFINKICSCSYALCFGVVLILRKNQVVYAASSCFLGYNTSHKS